jgi:hypothetical protein
MNSQMNIQMNTHSIPMLTNEQASNPYQRGKQPVFVKRKEALTQRVRRNT